MEAVDDITIRYTCLEPNFNFPLVVSGNSCSHSSSGKGETHGPAHFLKQFHIKYNPDVETMAKAEGLESWEPLFSKKSLEASTPEVPNMRPWVLKNDSASQLWIGERNPLLVRCRPRG